MNGNTLDDMVDLAALYVFDPPATRTSSADWLPAWLTTGNLLMRNLEEML